MNSIVKRRFTLTAVAGVALAAGLAAASAQAREPEVQWSVTIGTPVVTYPVPVPVYRPPVVVVPAAPAYPVPVYAVPRYYRQPTYWDRDGDGIPNRYDRFYNPPWDRDGDGIPDRYERHPHHWDRDGRHDGGYRDGGYRDGWRDDGRHHRDPWSTPTMSDR